MWYWDPWSEWKKPSADLVVCPDCSLDRLLPTKPVPCPLLCRRAKQVATLWTPLSYFAVYKSHFLITNVCAHAHHTCAYADLAAPGREQFYHSSPSSFCLCWSQDFGELNNTFSSQNAWGPLYNTLAKHYGPLMNCAKQKMF